MFFRTCFKKQDSALKCCGFVNPQRAALGISQTVGRTKPLPLHGLLNPVIIMALNSICPSELQKKPSFEEKTRFQGKSFTQKDFSNRLLDFLSVLLEKAELGSRSQSEVSGLGNASYRKTKCP